MSNEIASWLRGLGLEQYAAAFRDNAIDAAILHELTADDLKDLGVNLVGHRRKLLAAIAALTAEPPASEAARAPVSAEPAPAAADAERRQLTVMFCDLVGSTALSTRFDPEDLRELIGDYHRAVSATVGRFAGFVAKYMGDGVLIYFGYPQAHEDDAERAVRAGLAVIEAVGRLPAQQDLSVRLGIATGLAVVGDLIGAGAAQERGVIGETPNLAARLQALAAPNTLVIADATRRQVGGLFELADLGPQGLAGFAEPQRAWRVVGESGVLSRFEALRSGTTPLVGRTEELDLLRRRWEQAKAGEGRMVLLSGEPGIGKSRLTAALYEHIADEPHTRVRYFCSPHHQDSALHPVIAQLERAAGFARDDTAEQKLAKLAGALAADARGGNDIALLGDLLGVPSPAPDLDVDPQRKRQRTFAALLRQLDALSRGGPVLVVFEDVHWIDPTSRELLDLMVERVLRLPVLLLATCRPEFQHGWSGRPHLTVMALNRLGGREGAALVERLAGAAGLSSEMIAEIVERTDGVPLFVEELTKAVLEGGAPGDRVAAVLSAMPGSAQGVPATLHASLMARLDRLGPVAKEIAQVGAVLGREFTYDLIRPVAQRPDGELRPALDRLSEAGLLFCRGVAPNASYLFKHALVQDAAYGTLLRGRRQELHGRVADALLAPGGQAPDTGAEIIAHHLQNAGRSAEAIVHWRKAGEQALRRAAYHEAVAHLRCALSLVEAQAETAERWRTELAILSQLGPALMSVLGWSAPEVGDVVERAAEVGRRLESSADIAPAVANLWLFNAARGRLDRASEISADLFRMARELGDPEIMLQAHHCAWATKFSLGLLGEAGVHLDSGGAIYDEQAHAHHRHIYLGHDPGVCRLGFSATLQWVLGYPERGARFGHDGIVLARRLQHAPSLANALWRGAEILLLNGDVAAVAAMAQELLSLTDAHGLPMPRAYAMIFQGWVLFRSGATGEGIARMEEGLPQLAKMGAHLHFTAFSLLGEAMLAAGRSSDGLAHIERTLEIVEQSGERWYLPRLYQLRAELLLHAHGRGDEAVEANLLRAIAVARQQGAKGWEVGAATSLARLWGEQGRRADAHGLLAPVLGSFTEGFDTTELKAAQALLDELG